MGMDPATVIAGFGAIIAWLAMQRQAHNRARDQEKAAIEAIYRAANETRQYINRVSEPYGRGNESRDRDKEDELSRLWMEASNAMLDVSIGLADRCMIKSGYWNEPENWTTEEVQVADISLDSILEAAGNLRRAYV
jgi:hypothetical protein